MIQKRTFLATAVLSATLAFVGCQNARTESAAKPADAAKPAMPVQPVAPAEPVAPSMPVAKAQDMVAFGEPVPSDGATVTVTQLLGNVAAYEGKPVRVTGTVDKVCEHAGCWLQMIDGEKALFVKFTCPVNGRLIPLEAVGHKVIAAGQLKVVEVSEEDARHLAEEAGEPEAKIEAIKGPQKRITLDAPGAVVYGIAK